MPAARKPDAIRVTTASSSKAEDIASRQKKYLLSMSLRSLCFIGAVSTAIISGPGLITWILIAGAIVLPYIAVVLANVSTSRSDGFALLDTTHRKELGSATPTAVPGPDAR